MFKTKLEILAGIVGVAVVAFAAGYYVAWAEAAAKFLNAQ